MHLTMTELNRDLYQSEIEELTEEEYSYFLAHGSLDADRD